MFVRAHQPKVRFTLRLWAVTNPFRFGDTADMPKPIPSAPLSYRRRWWHSLFIKTFAGMLAASWLSTLLLSYVAVLEMRQAQRLATTPEQLLRYLQREIDTPVDDQANCQLLLEALLDRLLLSEEGLLRYSANSADGRLALRYRNASGHGCQHPERVTPELQLAMTQAGQQLSSRVVAQLGQEPDSGWLSVAALQTAAGAQLTLGLHSNSAWQSFIAQSRGQWGDLSVYLLMISALPAFAVAWFMVRRIRRAERVAEAWAGGDLRQRIGDRGHDEFSRLAQRFDQMADALARQLEVRQALAAAEERNRLARDLHDTAKQRSFALGLQLSVLRQMPAGDPTSSQRLETALALAAQLQHDLAEVIQRYSAPTVAEVGLRRAMTDSLRLLLEGSAIELVLDFEDVAERRLSSRPDQARELLMIATEAAANALRHSHASRLEVVLRSDGESLLWRISDNGQGFDLQTAATRGIGLASMRQRAHTLPAGRFDLASTVNGSTVSITFWEDER